MNVRRLGNRLLIAVAIGHLSVRLALAQPPGPSPVVEYSTIFSSLDVYPQIGRVDFGHRDQFTAAFLPQGAQVSLTLTKAGSDRPVYQEVLRQRPLYGMFTDLIASEADFVFEEQGNYVLTFQCNDKLMTEFPFEVHFLQSDDPFDPQKMTFVRGPWDEWAQLFLPREENALDPEGTPEFRIWMNRPSLDMASGSDIISVEIRNKGDQIAVASPSHVSGHKHQNVKFPFQYPDDKGGQHFKTKDLTARDGVFELIVRKNDALYGVYQYEVKQGKISLHARQQMGYKPSQHWMIARYAGEASHREGVGDIYWMERITGAAAKKLANQGPSAAITNSSDERERWVWQPSADPKRPFKVVITDIKTRSDTMLSAGDDLIAFGTGFPSGVRYMKVGDTTARDIPDGETYSSKVFRVCGHKIVLVKKNSVVIFDTETQQLTPIPESEISLYDVKGGLHDGNLLSADGFLVATINRATSVADRTVLKIIDLSGPEPQIIPIKNAGYTDRDVSSVAIDAKDGVVAVSSAQRKMISAAKISRLANQFVFDMSDYQGVNRQQIFIERNCVTYLDADWNVRHFNLDNPIPQAITDQKAGPSSNSFFVRQGRLAVATTEKFGTRYQFAISDLPEPPRVAPGTATPIEGTSGGAGMGGCAAIALDKTVFLTGTPSGGIGVGEHLQMLDQSSGQWVPIKDNNGGIISAIDGTTSIGLLAFKAGGRSKPTTIGYATYGESISLSSAAAVTTTPSIEMKPTEGAIPLKFDDDNTYNTHDEQAEAMVSSFLETEQELVAAFSGAFGKAAGEKRAVETILQSIGTDNPELLREYQLRSPYILDKPKPVASAPMPVDPASVATALNGDWSCLRMTVQGDDLPDEQIDTVRLTFANGKYVMAIGNNLETGSYTFDASKKPFEIDISAATGDDKGTVRRGSFKLLEGDRLLLVLGNSDKNRPQRFVSTNRNLAILSVYSKK